MISGHFLINLDESQISENNHEIIYHSEIAI